MTRDRQGPEPPDFLRLAGHPVRWRLLSELARSDRQVRELTALLGEQQSLVSYHLGQLRAGGIVAMRRSSADGRDTYYALDLPRCGDLLTAAGGSLHPGLRLVAPPVGAGATPAGPPARVLFLCTGNSARSQIAEALLDALADGRAEARSAGSRPKPLHPNAVRVLRTRGIDVSGRRSKHLDVFRGEHFDYVISMCDRVREVCPEFPGHPEMIHWSLPDPSADGPDEATYPAFERLADEVDNRVRFLLHQICHRSTESAHA